MSQSRIPPSDFVAQLRQFPDFVELRYCEPVGRWEFVFTSAANVPVSQFYGWHKNPLTGAPIEADPVSGLLPYRDICDATAQAEILENCKRTYLGNREDGAGTWKEQIESRSRFNRDKRKASAKQRGEDFAYLISQMDIRRPGWRKDHQPGKKIIVVPK